MPQCLGAAGLDEPVVELAQQVLLQVGAAEVEHVEEDPEQAVAER